MASDGTFRKWRHSKDFKIIGFIPSNKIIYISCSIYSSLFIVKGIISLSLSLSLFLLFFISNCTIFYNQSVDSLICPTGKDLLKVDYTANKARLRNIFSFPFSSFSHSLI